MDRFPGAALMARVKRWHERDTAPGYVLLAAAIASFALLNAPFGQALHQALEHPFTAIGPHPISLHVFINDGLMAIFFLFVGLELKRETIDGPFANPRQAALPLAGALGGMAAPAFVYLSFAGRGFAHGWAIPAATDIAFALGVLAILGSRVPAGLRLFLLALAIIDDLGAIVVIAFFYSTHLFAPALLGSGAIFAIMLALNRARVSALWPYWLLGAVLWLCLLLSGVQPTIAGVLTALATPMRGPNRRSPLLAAEHALKPWVQFAIMPIFALANAGVAIAGLGAEVFVHPVALGAGLGLFLGKPLGIALAAWAAGALLKQSLPGSPLHMLGVGCVAGVGFTMSLFIGGLAFDAAELAAPVRLGVLGGSIASAFLGVALLWLAGGDGRASQLAAEEERAEAEGVLEDRQT